MEIEKIIHDLVQKTYLAGMMHGEGLLGSDEHKKMFDEGQALYAELKAFLTPRVPDAGDSAAFQGLSNAKAFSASQALSTPTLRR